MILPLLSLASLTSGQTLLWERIGAAGVHELGNRLARLGDIDRDGFQDFVHIVRVSDPARIEIDSQVWVISGRDGTTISTFDSQTGFHRQYDRISGAGDMDGDGSPDYAVTLNDVNQGQRVVEVRSGVDHRLIRAIPGSWSQRFGGPVLGGLELDGDERPDLVVGAIFATTWGTLYAYSNQGQLLYQVDGDSDYIFDWQEKSMARLADIDGDGCNEFVAGAKTSSNGSGAGLVISGRTGRILTIGLGERAFDGVGFSATGCGDLDGDRIEDFALGAQSSFTPVDSVQAFSGASGRRLFVWREGPQMHTGFGQAIVGNVDVDHDGVPDVIASAPGENVPGMGTGVIHAHSGRDGSKIFSLLHPNRFGGASTGLWMDALGPQPGDPFGTFVFSVPSYRPTNPEPLTNQGIVACYRGSPRGVTTLGDACQGTLPAAPRMGLRGLGPGGTRLTLHGAPPSAPAALGLGFSSTSWNGIPLP